MFINNKSSHTASQGNYTKQMLRFKLHNPIIQNNQMFINDKSSHTASQGNYTKQTLRALS